VKSADKLDILLRGLKDTFAPAVSALRGGGRPRCSLGSDAFGLFARKRGLTRRERNNTIYLAVLTLYRNVSDGRNDRQTDGHADIINSIAVYTQLRM